MMDILYEDKNLIVVVKPSNMPVQKDFSRTPDMMSELEGYLGHQAYLIHRLDRHVSGPIVVAKTKEEAARLNKQLLGPGFMKIYQAVSFMDIDEIPVSLNGEALDKELDIDLYYKKYKGVSQVIDVEAYTKLVVREQKLFKRGKMIVKKLEALEENGGLIQMLEIDLKTGRFHQIRSGLKFMGLPIIGDPKYGINEIGGKSFSTIGLQCVRLGFVKKGDKEMTVFENRHNKGPFEYFRL